MLNKSQLVILEPNSLAPKANASIYCTCEQRHVSKLICSLFLTDSGDACIFFPIDAQASGVNCGSMSLSNTFCIGWQGIRLLIEIHLETSKEPFSPTMSSQAAISQHYSILLKVGKTSHS